MCVLVVDGDALREGMMDEKFCGRDEVGVMDEYVWRRDERVMDGGIWLNYYY